MPLCNHLPRTCALNQMCQSLLAASQTIRQLCPQSYTCQATIHSSQARYTQLQQTQYCTSSAMAHTTQAAATHAQQSWSSNTQQPSRSRVRCYSSSSSSSSIPPLPVVYHPLFSAPQLAPGHRFPMQVFRVIYERLISQSIIHPSQVHCPQQLPTDAELALVHCPDYLEAFSGCTLDDQRVRRIGFGATTRTPLLVDRTKSEVAGTLLTAQLALQHGLAVSTAGGTHHAFADAGSGFCILNDLAYTAHRLQQQQLVERVVILDLDVHQGDGTAAMCANNPNIFTLSVHAASNFPARKQQSSLDVALPDGVQDDAYLQAVAGELPEVLQAFRPQLVLYDAGVDVHEADELGRLAVSSAGLMRRELLVLDSCLGAGIPVAGYVGGGYDKDLNLLAERHMALHRAALRMWTDHGL